MISRTITGSQGSHQAKLISRDNGLTWSNNIEYAKDLQGTVCDIGLTRYSYNPNIILVSQPSKASVREELVIRMSRDEGRSLNRTRLLQKGRATYSDLAILPDQTIICLFGKGGGGTSPKSVNLIRFRLEWLLED